MAKGAGAVTLGVQPQLSPAQLSHVRVGVAQELVARCAPCFACFTSLLALSAAGAHGAVPQVPRLAWRGAAWLQGKVFCGASSPLAISTTGSGKGGAPFLCQGVTQHHRSKQGGTPAASVPDAVGYPGQAALAAAGFGQHSSLYRCRYPTAAVPSLTPLSTARHAEHRQHRALLCREAALCTDGHACCQVDPSRSTNMPMPS